MRVSFTPPINISDMCFLELHDEIWQRDVMNRKMKKSIMPSARELQRSRRKKRSESIMTCSFFPFHLTELYTCFPIQATMDMFQQLAKQRFGWWSRFSCSVQHFSRTGYQSLHLLKLSCIKWGVNEEVYSDYRSAYMYQYMGIVHKEFFYSAKRERKREWWWGQKKKKNQNENWIMTAGWKGRANGKRDGCLMSTWITDSCVVQLTLRTRLPH